MLALVFYRACGEKNGPCLLRGVRVCAVYVARGDGPAARLSARRAAHYLRRRGIRRAVFPPQYPHAALFARRGILPPDTAPLRLALADRIVASALAPRDTRLALVSAVPSPALAAAASALAPRVRYLTLCAPDAPALARALRWDCGVSALPLRPDAFFSADLAAVFDASCPRTSAPVLPILSCPLSLSCALPPVCGRLAREPLLAALFSLGALSRGEITVESANFPPEAPQNAIAP